MIRSADARPPNANARRQAGRSAKRSKADARTYRTRSLARQIRWLRTIQWPFDFAFWFIEQKIAKRQDELDDRRAFLIKHQQLLPERMRVARKLAISGGTRP